MKQLAYVAILLIFSSMIYAETSSSSINWATPEWVRMYFCQQGGSCNLTNLTVVNEKVININSSGNITGKNLYVDKLFINSSAGDYDINVNYDGSMTNSSYISFTGNRVTLGYDGILGDAVFRAGSDKGIVLKTNEDLRSLAINKYGAITLQNTSTITTTYPNPATIRLQGNGTAKFSNVMFLGQSFNKYWEESYRTSTELWFSFYNGAIWHDALKISAGGNINIYNDFSTNGTIYLFNESYGSYGKIYQTKTGLYVTNNNLGNIDIKSYNGKVQLQYGQPAGQDVIVGETGTANLLLYNNLTYAQNVNASCISINNTKKCDWSEITAVDPNAIRNYSDAILYKFNASIVTADNISAGEIKATDGIGDTTAPFAFYSKKSIDAASDSVLEFRYDGGFSGNSIAHFCMSPNVTSTGSSNTGFYINYDVPNGDGGQNQSWRAAYFLIDVPFTTDSSGFTAGTNHLITPAVFQATVGNEVPIASDMYPVSAIFLDPSWGVGAGVGSNSKSLAWLSNGNAQITQDKRLIFGGTHNTVHPTIKQLPFTYGDAFIERNSVLGFVIGSNDTQIFINASNNTRIANNLYVDKLINSTNLTALNITTDQLNTDLITSNLTGGNLKINPEGFNGVSLYEDLKSGAVYSSGVDGNRVTPLFSATWNGSYYATNQKVDMVQYGDQYRRWAWNTNYASTFGGYLFYNGNVIIGTAGKGFMFPSSQDYYFTADANQKHGGTASTSFSAALILTQLSSSVNRSAELILKNSNVFDYATPQTRSSETRLTIAGNNVADINAVSWWAQNVSDTLINSRSNLTLTTNGILYLNPARGTSFGANKAYDMTSGDINVSTVYYSTLSAKSPIVFELGGSMILTRVKGGDWVECDLNKPGNCPAETESKMQKLNQQRSLDKASMEMQSKKIGCDKSYGSYDPINDVCAIDLQKQCESKIWQYWKNNKCYVNTYLDCMNNPDKKYYTWNEQKNKCEYDQLKEYQTQCLAQNNKKWLSGACIDDSEAICKSDRSKLWINNNCVDAPSIEAQ